MQWHSDPSIFVKGNDTFCRINTVEGIQSSLHRVAQKRVGGDRTGGDKVSSFTTYPRELSTAPPSSLCRCFGHVYKILKIFDKQLAMSDY